METSTDWREMVSVTLIKLGMYGPDSKEFWSAIDDLQAAHDEWLFKNGN